MSSGLSSICKMYSKSKMAEPAVVRRAEEVSEHQERILLPDRDLERFFQLMRAETQPTETALREATEFRQGQMDGLHYRW